MNIRPTDPLLTAAKLLVIVTQAIIALLATGICIGIGALLTVGRTEVFAKIAEAGAPPIAFGLLLLSLALIVVMLGIGFRFFKELRGIIDSVSDGEPFDAENATRLYRMGWIAVGAQFLGLTLAGLAAWFYPYLTRLAEPGDEIQLQFGFGFDGGGLLLTLLLFILARVFRRGAEMRADLEGTV